MAQVNRQVHVLKGGDEIVVRCAEPGDVRALEEFYYQGLLTSQHNVTEPDEFSLRGDRCLELVREGLSNPNRLVLLAIGPHGVRDGRPDEADTADGRIIGSLEFKDHNRRRMAHHGSFGIGVAESWRGRGVGRVLIATLLEWATAHPLVEKVCLGVFASNTRARALYASMGFTDECLRRREFKIAPGVYEDDIQMSLWVKKPFPEDSGARAPNREPAGQQSAP